MDPDSVHFTLVVDDEGVVRVGQWSTATITLTPVELGQLLTACVKALVGPDDDEQTVDVRMN